MQSRIILSFESEFIPFDTFTQAIQGLGDILYEIDRDISGRYTLEWGIHRVRDGDKSIEAIPRLLNPKWEDNSDVIIPTFLKGLRIIRQKAERPVHFSDEALSSAGELSYAVNGDIRRITITGSINGKLAKPIQITRQVGSNVKQVIGPRYKALGSVEGKLEMISIRHFNRFGITHSLSGKSVKCRFPFEMLEQVKSALGKRVMASGIVHYNSQHEPVRVDVEWLRILRTNEELPSAQEIGGSDPDFTGGLTTEEYLRNLRG